MTRAPQVILGVTGCVGAFKAVLLLRLMRKAGWEVRTVLTEAGKEFVGEATFHALSGRPVVKDVWDLDASPGGELHVDLTDWADALVVYPATANLLAGVAAGLSDDLLRLTLLCFDGPKLLVDGEDGVAGAVVQGELVRGHQPQLHPLLQAGAGQLAPGLGQPLGVKVHAEVRGLGQRGQQHVGRRGQAAVHLHQRARGQGHEVQQQAGEAVVPPGLA